MRLKPQRLSCRWNDLYFVCLKCLCMMVATKALLLWTLNARPCGSHETMESSPLLSQSASMSNSFHGNNVLPCCLALLLLLLLLLMLTALPVLLRREDDLPLPGLPVVETTRATFVGIAGVIVVLTEWGALSEENAAAFVGTVVDTAFDGFEDDWQTMMVDVELYVRCLWMNNEVRPTVCWFMMKVGWEGKR